MTPVHHAKAIPGYDRLVRATGPALPLHPLTPATNQSSATMPADSSSSFTPQQKADASAEFNRQVNERMGSAGENFGAAWSYVQQTQPRLYAQMNGDTAADKELAAAGRPAPTIRK